MGGRHLADHAHRTPPEDCTSSARRRPRPDPRCGNCDGRGCMGCVFREYDHTCEDDCPTCCAGPYPEHVVQVWRDETLSPGHSFSWRARCLCMGDRPRKTGWKPAWNASTHGEMVDLAHLHASDPRDDDWLRLSDYHRHSDGRWVR